MFLQVISKSVTANFVEQNRICMTFLPTIYGFWSNLKQSRPKLTFLTLYLGITFLLEPWCMILTP